MKATYVVITDCWGQQHAQALQGEGRKAIETAARYLMSNVAICDHGEVVDVGLVEADDAGAARLMKPVYQFQLREMREGY